MNKAQRDIRRKKRVLEHEVRSGNVRKACRYCGAVGRQLPAASHAGHGHLRAGSGPPQTPPRGHP